MSLLAISVFIIATIFFLIWFVRLLWKNREFYKSIPTVPPIFFFGNIFEVSSTKEILDVLLKYSKEFDGLYKIYLGPVRTIVITTNYKLVEAVLSSTKILNKSDDYLYLRPWLGTGLLTSDGPKWKKHRKILTPAFHFQILEQFLHVFENAGNNLVQKLHNKVGNKTFDIYPFVTLCTLDIICESAMGTSINAQFDDNSDYVRSVKAMCRIMFERLINILQIYDITYPLTKNYYTQKKSLKVLHAQTNNVITKRRKELQDQINNKINEEKDSTADKKKTFLDLLLHATVEGKPLTQEEIREEVDTFMFEGHDTTASAISFIIYCLANNPEVQEKAYKEQLSIFGPNKTPTVTYSDIQSMKYLEMVIKETLRLYPSVPMFARKTNEPVKCNDIIVPEGVQINIFAYGIHRDPKYFKDPEKFDPTRFETIDGKMPYAYVPFSAGPRNCIGQKFAMLEMKSTVSKVLRHFEFKPAVPTHKPELVAEAVLKSANGIKVGIYLRT